MSAKWRFLVKLRWKTSYISQFWGFYWALCFFVDIWADFCGKLARFREFLTHIGIFEHFWDIFDPYPIQKSAILFENQFWTYIEWHQKLFYELQSLRNHVISHCYSRRTLISINLLKNQNSIQMGDSFLNPLKHFNCSIRAFISFRSDQESENICEYLSEFIVSTDDVTFHRWRHHFLVTAIWLT